jgi:spermidine/putrescine-binding protein
MNTYVAFYKDKEIQVEAETKYKAQLKAAAQFKVKQGQEYKVTVELVALGVGENAKKVVHVAVN